MRQVDRSGCSRGGATTSASSVPWACRVTSAIVSRSALPRMRSSSALAALMSSSRTLVLGPTGPFLELDPEMLEAMIDVNLKGTLYTAAATLPHLIAGGEGDFVSVASVAGLRAFPGEAVYDASKFGQVGFTRALDHELHERGVRATCICPGGVKTNFAIGAGRVEGDPELEGMLTADEVAEVVLFTVTRPRRMRILTTSFRPMTEASWG